MMLTAGSPCHLSAYQTGHRKVANKCWREPLPFSLGCLCGFRHSGALASFEPPWSGNNNYYLAGLLRGLESHMRTPGLMPGKVSIVSLSRMLFLSSVVIFG